ncbi:N-acetyltransferase [Jiangella ureilytica]|uniref:N-acetyltransferase n=2 Tax=Jiangella ureilytica TaxID=2530374 RepID=A0A4R4RRN8_9ACTN|nr:N-acetyltransferase [Jiangella ureilytica]
MASMTEIAVVPATVELLDALVERPAEFEAAIGAPIPAGWPEFPESVGFSREHLADHPEEAGWWMYFFVDPSGPALIGSGGFAGPPRDRVVEIGYEVAPAFRGRGLGTAAAAALVRRAVDSGEVDAVVAHTLVGENPSTQVLARLGFTRVAELADPEQGTVWQWRWERD